MKELLLARAFSRSPHTGRPHASFVISTLSTLLGVTFLVLTIGVYDSYAHKLETITFSMYPHVLIFEDWKPEAGVPTTEVLDDGERCRRICRGQLMFGSSTSPKRHPSTARLSEIRSVLGDLRGHAAAVILEERDLRCRFQRAGRMVREVHSLRIFGIDPHGPALVPQVDLFIPPDLLSALRGGGSRILVSQALGESLFGHEAVAGRVLTVERPGRTPLPLQVVGSFSLGFHSAARNMVVTSLETAQNVLNMPEQASSFGVTLPDPYDSPETLKTLRERLRGKGLPATDWMTIARGDFESIRLFRWILFLVLGMSVVITSFSIRNTLVILTLERRRQIGILRALGLRDSSIRGIFLWLGLGIGLWGSVLGLIAGTLLSISFGRWMDGQLSGILPIQGVEMSFQPLAMTQVFAAVMTVCLLTGLLSVRRALNLDPGTCLQAE